MRDLYTPYEIGLQRLLEQLGRDHPAYHEALVYEARLRENIATVRAYGDTETDRANRARIIAALNSLAEKSSQTSFNELCGFRQPITVLLDRFFTHADLPPDMPLHEKAGNLAMVTLGQLQDDTSAAVMYGLAFLILSGFFAGWLAQAEQHLAGQVWLFWGVTWLGLTVLPLIAGALPQQREKTLRSELTARQRLALRLDKVAGVYISAYLGEIAAILTWLGLIYLGLWSQMSLLSKAAFWFVSAGWTFILSFIGAVIATKYWENLRREGRRIDLSGSHFLLALGFPLIVYPAIVIFGFVTLPLWQNPVSGCLIIAFGLLFMAWQLGRQAKSKTPASVSTPTSSPPIAEHSPEQPEKLERNSDVLPSPLTPDRNPRMSSAFKLQLTQRDEMTVEVRALETPMGEPHAVSQLPYTAEQLIAVLKALRGVKQFTPAQSDILEQLGLVIDSDFTPDLHQRIGQRLYEALLPGEVHTAFQMALNQARPAKGTVALQVRFDEDAVALAHYPWELLYQRRALLPSRAVALSRYISYPEAVTPLAVAPPLRLLYIQARPVDLPRLPDQDEQRTVRQALDPLAASQVLSLNTLSRPTYDALLDYLESQTVHILHFDGHGVFARRCPACGAMNYPHLSHCQAPQDETVCGQDLIRIEPQGYLAFEDEGRRAQWMGSKTLGGVLYNRPLRLVVLSACWSSRVGGETLFGGTAPALIQAGVPAVVSTQLPISVEGTIRFMRGFYAALTRFETLPAAVNAGRLRMFDTPEWFSPTLYLRSQDNEGRLFAQLESKRLSGDRDN